MAKINCILLKLLREASGFTQKVFAERCGVGQAFLSKYENGSLEPTEDALVKIADALMYPINYLRQPAFEISSGLVFHRKHASLKAADRSKIEARARLFAFDAVKVAKTAGCYSDIMGRDGRTPVDAARAARSRWNASAGPIPNMVQFLEEHGIFVLAFDFGTDKLDGFFLPIYEEDGQEAVCIALNVNSAFTPDRQRFTLAHELGHAILHRREFPSDMKIAETEANAFAAELLMPYGEIKGDLGHELNFETLKALKMKWRVSMSAIAHRAHEMHQIGDSGYKKTIFLLQACGCRKQEPQFGIEFERPQLMQSLMTELYDRREYPDELLNLGDRRFARRYGSIMTGGGVLMT